jgi:hypothetical protein
MNPICIEFYRYLNGAWQIMHRNVDINERTIIPQVGMRLKFGDGRTCDYWEVIGVCMNFEDGSYEVRLAEKWEN